MKNKFALLLITMVVYTSVFSADKSANKDKKEFKRVYIGFSFTPAVSYRYLHGNFVPSGSSQADIQGAVDYGNKHSVPEFGVNAAFKVGINLTNWLAVESGIGYSLIRYRYNSDMFYSPNVFNGQVHSLLDSFQTTDKETYQYMTIPIGLCFSMGHKKVRGIIAAGADLDFLLRQKAEYTYAYVDGTHVSNSSVQTGNFNTFNVSPYLGVGIDCYLSRAVVLRVMPQAQIQGLKNINAPVTEYLWNAGLNISLLFGL